MLETPHLTTITAGVNLLNNTLHDYQTENARELANQVRTGSDESIIAPVIWRAR